MAGGPVVTADLQAEVAQLTGERIGNARKTDHPSLTLPESRSSTVPTPEQIMGLKTALNLSGLFQPALDAKNETFGPQTSGAVRWFQLVKSIPVTGEVDAQTRAELLKGKPVPASINRIATTSAIFPTFSADPAAQKDFERVLCGELTLKRGPEATQHSAAVTEVQKLLNSTGKLKQPINPDGDFGLKTELANRNVQIALVWGGPVPAKDYVDARGLALLLPSAPNAAFHDGKMQHAPTIVDVLQPVLAGRCVLEMGSQGEDVRAYQMLLKKIFPEQQVTGQFGPQTLTNTKRACAVAHITEADAVGMKTLPAILKLAAEADAKAAASKH